MSECLFCRIVNGEIPCKKAYEDETTLAFFDINPQAPVHILVIPKTHISSLNALTEEHGELFSHLVFVAKKLAAEHAIAENGYRIVVNTGDNGGQTVHHLHVHILGGRFMTWPPG